MSLTQSHLLSQFFACLDQIDRVIVIGDYLLDRYVIGDVTRVSPEAPVPILSLESQENRPGGAGNVAQNLADLNIHTECIGVVGDDPEGFHLKNLLSHIPHVQTTHILEDKNRNTSLKTRFIAKNKQLMRLDRETVEPLSSKIRSQFNSLMQFIIKPSDLIFVSDYNKGVVDQDLIRKLKKNQANSWISVDPKFENYSKYKGADLLTPNQKEAEHATGIEICSDESVTTCLRKLYTLTKIPFICLTRSDKGMALYEGPYDRVTYEPAWAEKKICDVTGAGDTVLTFMSLGLSRGLPPPLCLKIASLAAYLVIQKLGTCSVTKRELIEAWPAIKQKVQLSEPTSLDQKYSGSRSLPH